MKKASTDFREIGIPMVKNNLKNSDEETTTGGLLQSLSVYKVDPTVVLNDSAIAAQVKIKDESGRSVSQFAATEGNLIAVKMIKDREVRTKLEKYPRALLIEIYKVRASGKTPDEIPEEFKEVFEMELPKLEAFLMGEMPSDKELNKLLNLLSL